MFADLVKRWRAAKAYRPRHADEPPADTLGPASYYTSRTGAWSPTSAKVMNRRRYP